MHGALLLLLLVLMVRWQGSTLWGGGPSLLI
jgi:hypothetical protein